MRRRTPGIERVGKLERHLSRPRPLPGGAAPGAWICSLGSGRRGAIRGGSDEHVRSSTRHTTSEVLVRREGFEPSTLRSEVRGQPSRSVTRSPESPCPLRSLGITVASRTVPSHLVPQRLGTAWAQFKSWSSRTLGSAIYSSCRCPTLTRLDRASARTPSRRGRPAAPSASDFTVDYLYHDTLDALDQAQLPPMLEAVPVRVGRRIL